MILLIRKVFFWFAVLLIVALTLVVGDQAELPECMNGCENCCKDLNLNMDREECLKRWKKMICVCKDEKKSGFFSFFSEPTIDKKSCRKVCREERLDYFRPEDD